MYVLGRLNMLDVRKYTQLIPLFALCIIIHTYVRAPYHFLFYDPLFF